jgi:hypothetical protein
MPTRAFEEYRRRVPALIRSDIIAVHADELQGKIHEPEEDGQEIVRESQ